MEDLFTWLTTTPWGLAAVVFGLMILFALYAFMSERKTRRLFPDQDRRGTKAVAKKKAKSDATKSSSKSTKSGTTPNHADKSTGTTKTTSSNKATSTKKASEKPSSKAADNDDDEAFSLEGFFESLWGDEETGKKGLIESLWEDDEEGTESSKGATTNKTKAKPQSKQTTKKDAASPKPKKEPEE